MTTTRHLTEGERQGAADGTLAAEQMHDAETHMAECGACAVDVASLRTLMTRIHAPAPAEELDDLWPDIQSRIEASKVIPIEAQPAASSPRVQRKRLWVAVGVVAAGLIFMYSVPQLQYLRAGAARIAPADSEPGLINVADSTSAYEQEANTLLNELQMRRAMMRPQTSASIDRDLRVVDQAIAEVKDALVRDPNNPALRRLLASSYRQKVELLKRASNAG
ncbi:MAG: hypothetical protein JWM41_3066 [Gemmatimonadetes bacterium]|nr:hypothetical protein [Gemmatimonadota bacterium]